MKGVVKGVVAFDCLTFLDFLESVEPEYLVVGIAQLH